MISKNLINLACGFGAFGVMAADKTTDNFDKYKNSKELHNTTAGQHSFELSRGTGIDKSQCVKLVGNGSTFMRKITVKPEPGRSLIVEADVKINNGSGFCRFIFGDKPLHWRRFQGRVDLKPDQKIYISGAKKGTRMPVFASDKWYKVKFVIKPNLIRGGKYSFYLNGNPVCKNVKMSFPKNETTQFGFIYLAKKKGAIYIDNLSVRAGYKYKVKPSDLIGIILPKKPLGGYRFRNGKVDLDCKLINASALKSCEFVLYPNHMNFLDQAEKDAAATFKVNNPPKEIDAKFSGVPYGMHTLRITGTMKNGKKVVLLEQLISVLHDTPTQEKGKPGSWGICTHADRFDRRPDLDMMNLREAGANWTRLEMTGPEICRDGKNYDFSHHDKVWAEAKKTGVECFGLINCVPKGFELIPGSGWGCQPNLKKWEEHCRTIMTHYKGKITYWEVWNEPAHFGWDWFTPGYERPLQYAKMIKIATKVAKEVDPENEVMGPCATRNMNGYLLNVAKDGGFKDVNYISLHVRKFPDYVSIFYNERLKKIYGRDFKFWFSEGANDPKGQVAGLAGEAPVAGFAYVIRDKGTGRHNYEHYNGYSKKDGQPKDRLIKYQYMAKSLANSKFIGKIYSGNDISGYLFERDGKYNAVIWKRYDQLPGKFMTKAGIEKPIPLPRLINKNGIKIYDALGNPVKTDQVSTPLLYLDNIAEDGPTVADGCINMEEEYNRMDTAEVKNLTFTFYNPTSSSRTYVLRSVSTGEYKLPAVVKVKVAPGKKITKKIHITVSDNISPQAKYLSAEIDVDNMKIHKVFGPVWFFDSKRLHTQKLDDFSGEFKWYLPKMTEDIHTQRSTGTKRKTTDQQGLSRGSSITLVSDPENPANKVGMIKYLWKRPEGKKKWGWMARRYSLKNPIPLPGEPVKIKMRIYMKDNIKYYPTVMMIVLKDKTGKEIRIEANEVFWKGWRTMECYIPSFISFGRVHSVSGGNKLRLVDCYPLEFTGIILNLVPANAVLNFPNDSKQAEGYLLIDDLEVEYYK